MRSRTEMARRGIRSTWKRGRRVLERRLLDLRRRFRVVRGTTDWSVNSWAAARASERITARRTSAFQKRISGTRLAAALRRRKKRNTFFAWLPPLNHDWPKKPVPCIAKPKSSISFSLACIANDAPTRFGAWCLEFGAFPPSPFRQHLSPMTPRRDLMLGVWSFSGAWMLELGAFL